MPPIKIAILGAGFISEIHCESYHRFVPGAEVIAVYTRNAEKAQSFAQKHDPHPIRLNMVTDFGAN